MGLYDSSLTILLACRYCRKIIRKSDCVRVRAALLSCLWRITLSPGHGIHAAYVCGHRCMQAVADVPDVLPIMRQAGTRPGVFDEGRDICWSARVEGMDITMLACHPVVFCGRHIAHCSSLYTAVINTTIKATTCCIAKDTIKSLMCISSSPP